MFISEEAVTDVHRSMCIREPKLKAFSHQTFTVDGYCNCTVYGETDCNSHQAKLLTFAFV